MKKAIEPRVYYDDFLEGEPNKEAVLKETLQVIDKANDFINYLYKDLYIDNEPKEGFLLKLVMLQN
jgi:hypothetical protein